MTVVIPIYNEARTLLEVVRRVLSVPLDLEVVCVDDGSTDGSTEVLRREVEPLVHRVVYLRPNAGKGSAIRAGIAHAGGGAVVVQDADLELDPHDLVRLHDCFVREPGCVVYGSRFRRAVEGLSWGAFLANRVLTMATNLLFAAHITDMATCYKMFPRKLIQSLPLRCRRFEFEPEVTARVLLRGVRIREVGIGYKPRTREQGKKIRWHDALSYLWWLCRCRLGG